jgi:hypothetical protein
MQKLLLTFIISVTCCRFGIAGTDGTINLPAANPTKHDLGFFRGGAELFISASGSAVLCEGYRTQPDGSLAAPVPVEDVARAHANAGSENYPTDFGGDGRNHFEGGGLNYVPGHGDISWPIAGKQTSNTTDSEAIRFGALVGTFSETPRREDWFYIGRGRSVNVPIEGAHLYLLVNDSWYYDNAGSYSVAITARSPATSPLAGELRSAPSSIYVKPKKVDILRQDYAFGYALPTEISLTHQIEMSGDLVNWTPATNVMFFFKDLDSINANTRFYRFRDLKTGTLNR